MFLFRRPMRRILGWAFATGVAFFLDPTSGAERRERVANTVRNAFGSRRSVTADQHMTAVGVSGRDVRR